MSSGSYGSCKSLSAIVGASVSSPPPLFNAFFVELIRRDDALLTEAALPLSAVVKSPSAVISHEEIIREARRYSWPAPTLVSSQGKEATTILNTLSFG